MHALLQSQLLEAALLSCALAGPLAQRVQAPSAAPIRLVEDSVGIESVVGLPGSSTVQDLTVGRSGWLFVLVGPTERLMRVSPSGNVIEVPLGGAQFADYSMRLGWLGDTLWAGGHANGRFWLYTEDGALLSKVGLSTDSTSDGTYLPTGATALLANGSGLARVEAPGTLVAGMEVLGQPLLTVLESGVVLDTLAWLRTTTAVMQLGSDEHPESGVILLRQPFRDTPLIGVSRLGDRIVIVNRDARVQLGNCLSYTVTALAPNGDTVFERRIEYAPIPIGRRVLVAVRQEIEEQALKSRHVFNDRGDVDRAIDRELWVPRYYPPADTVIVATDSSIWIRGEGGEEPTYWTVIGPRGKVIGKAVVPRNVKVLEIAPPFVWAVVLRPDTTERLVRYKLGDDYYTARRAGGSKR